MLAHLYLRIKSHSLKEAKLVLSSTLFYYIKAPSPHRISSWPQTVSFRCSGCCGYCNLYCSLSSIHTHIAANLSFTKRSADFTPIRLVVASFFSQFSICPSLQSSPEAARSAAPTTKRWARSTDRPTDWLLVVQRQPRDDDRCQNPQ